MPDYHCKQSGLSLVELMIAMLIGLFLLQGVLYVFQSSKSGFRLMESEAEMHDSALFAIESLNNTIRMAGHNDFNPAAPPTFFDPSQTYQDIVISGIDAGGADGDIIQGAEGAAGAPDRIDVFYEGAADGSTLDCLGGSVAAGTVVKNTFSIDAVNNELECGINNAAGQPLVSNVTDMQVTWGIDNIGGGDGEADQFVSIIALGTAAARDQIVALIITLTLASGTGDAVITNKTFTTAVALRNKL